MTTRRRVIRPERRLIVNCACCQPVLTEAIGLHRARVFGTTAGTGSKKNFGPKVEKSGSVGTGRCTCDCHQNQGIELGDPDVLNRTINFIGSR